MSNEATRERALKVSLRSSEWTTGEKLGAGAFGEVYKAHSNGSVVALKFIKKQTEHNGNCYSRSALQMRAT